jgi:hypothetical protein
MEKLRGSPHSEPLTDTWTSDFLSREGEGREVIGERLRYKTVSWQAQRSLMQEVTNSFQCGSHLHRMGLRGTTVAPCANELESKGWMIILTGVDGLIPKHWSTFRVQAALSKQEWPRQCTITSGNKFIGRYH